jgi:hypothetical protein
MRCAPNVTANLVRLSEPSDTPIEFTGDEPVKNATITTPHLRFTKAFFPEPQKLWKTPPSKGTQCGKSSNSNAMPRSDDYGDDADTRLRKFYEKAEPNTSHTLEEIAQAMGVTRERVRQIEDGAIRKFRRRFSQVLKSDGIDPLELLKDD